MGDYRKLNVWKRAQTLSHRARQLVKTLEPIDQAGIGDQITRSADSVRFNIAEGCGLNSDNQLARCLQLSLGSANELQDQLDALDENGLLPPEYQDLKVETSGVRSMLVGLYRAVKKRPR